MFKMTCFLVLSAFLSSCIHLAADDSPAQKKSTVLRFSVQSGDTAYVTVYNLLGNPLVEQTFTERGLHRVEIETFHLPKGIYLVRIKTRRSTTMKKAYVIP